MVFGTCRLPPLFTEGEIATVWRDQSDLHRQEKVEAMLEINRVRTWSLIKIFRVVFGFPFIVIGRLGFLFFTL